MAAEAARPDVLFVGHGAELSGPPIMLLHLQRWLAAHSDLATATLLGRGGDLVCEFERLGPVGVCDRGTTAADLAGRALRRAGRANWADRLDGLQTIRAARPLGDARLVYANTVAPATTAMVRACLGEGTPFLLHVHELTSTLRHRIPAADLRWLLTRADRIVTASGAVRDQLVDRFAADPDLISVCFEFVEPVTALAPAERTAARAALGLDPASSVIVGSGRIDWRKAPELLGQALWRVRRARPELDARVVWVGAGGDDRWQWTHDISTMGLDDHFTFVGEQADPGRWVQAADVFALCSREDAFPLACLEAAGAELPLVTFDTGGMVEFVDASGGGTVVPYPDVDAFAGALIELLVDDDRRARVGRKGASWVAAHHTVDAGARPIHHEIAALLADSRP